MAFSQAPSPKVSKKGRSGGLLVGRSPNEKEAVREKEARGRVGGGVRWLRGRAREGNGGQGGGPRER